MRIMGSNCFGTVVPRHRLNASYAHCMVEDGNVACAVSRGMALAFMDWARGGSCFASPRWRQLDIDVADVIEYFRRPPHPVHPAAPEVPGSAPGFFALRGRRSKMLSS
jgi:acetyltransferase